MVLNYTQFKLINFPIFAIPSDNLEVTDGLLRLGNLVIDDRNQIGETLGVRRLQTPHIILPLKFCYEDIQSLLTAKHKIFVDNKGYCFIYERTRFCNVVPHKILKVVVKGTHVVLKVSKVPFPVVVTRPPPLGKTWVGMLHFEGKPWIPYEYTEERCTIKRRKI